MGRKEILMPMVVEALEFHSGSATIVEVGKYILDNYSEVLAKDEDLSITWQYDYRWAADALRKDGAILPAEQSPRGVWELSNFEEHHHNPLMRKADLDITLDSILHAERGDVFSSSDIFHLFTGELFGNSPQKGIHWYPRNGDLEVIVISSTESQDKYKDRFIDEGETVFLYYLMIGHRHSNDSIINRESIENSILLKQNENAAPILLLRRNGPSRDYVCEGWFSMETHCHDDRENHDSVDSVLLVRSA
jgi:hypothetical protein